MQLWERCSSPLVRAATCLRPAVLAAAGACALFAQRKLCSGSRSAAEVGAVLMAAGDVPAPSRTLVRLLVVACYRVLECAAMLLFCPFAV